MDRRKFLAITSSSTAGIFAGTALSSAQLPTHPDHVSTAATEAIVIAATEDKLTQTGLVVTPSPQPAKPIAVVWVHGATANFYYPTYVAIARKMASMGYTFVLGNTRMHDIGCVLSDQGNSVRGGSLWGLPSKEPIDIAAWIDVTEKRGHSSVVLVGHSAGGPAVRRYMAERSDSRVIGWAQASVGLALWPPKPDPQRLKIATDMVAAGNGQRLLPIPNFVLSAGTFLDYAQTPEDIYDFYGIETTTPAVIRVRTPLLTFYGTNHDVGSVADLDRLRALIAKHAGGPVRVDTAIIQGADHDYTGKAEEVAQLLDKWIGSLKNPRVVR